MTPRILPDPKRGEVWRVNLEPTQGDEIRKMRPAVVISADTLGRLRLRIIVPVTEWREAFGIFPWMVPLDPDPESGLVKPSAEDTFQIRSVSLSRMVARLGTVSEEALGAISTAVALCIQHRPKA